MRVPLRARMCDAVALIIVFSVDAGDESVRRSEPVDAPAAVVEPAMLMPGQWLMPRPGR